MTSPDPAPPPTRRRFAGDYKAAIVAEYDGCTTAGEKGALLRYRILAYVVGTLLVVLVFGVIVHNQAIAVVLGTAHGYLYVGLLITIADLWRRRRFPLLWVVLVALAGTVPFLSFVAERQVTARVRDGRL